jgi:DNA-binding CsgD family transcriptional regulator
MDIQLAVYDELVHRVYDAALEPARWPAVVGGIGETCESSRGLLFTPLHRPSTGGFTFTHNISDGMVERWGATSVSDDPITSEALARGLFVEGNAVNGRELVSTERLLASRLYRDIWEPMDIGHVCSGIVFGGTDSRTLPTVVSIFRDANDPSFTASHLELMRRLMAHMSRSLGVMFHLRDSRLQAASNLGALARLSVGVALLDGLGVVQFANVAADRIFRSGKHVTAREARANGSSRLTLSMRLHRHEENFQRTIDRALAPLEDDSEHFSNAVVLPDEDGKPACVVHIAPLGHAPTLAASGRAPKVIVFLYDVGGAASVAPGLLTELFALTAAEARAALQILQGGAAEEMAHRLGVSVNTFKSQLKAVYAKTRTNRHSDLLKLMLALAMP